MPPVRKPLVGYVAGNKMNVRETVTDLPVGRTITKAWLTVKASVNDLDAAAIVQKTITTSPVAGQGQITDDGAGDLIGGLVFELTAADTALIGYLLRRQYDIKIKLDNLDTPTLVVGEMVFIKGVTDAVT